jgi:hypothetical protein
MSNITIVSKIRFLAGLAPVILLLVGPILALAFSAFGSIPSTMKENQLAALGYAQGLDAALYQMEWGRTQSDGSQIVMDQQRRFADLLDSATHHVYTAEQGEKLEALAQAAKPTLDAFRSADPHDEAENAKMRDLHTMVTALLNADEAAIDSLSDAANGSARRFAALVIIAGIVLPMACFAVIWRFTAAMRTDLRAIRTQIERLAESSGAKDPSIAPALEAIDQAVTRLGFPKPNPMLAVQ